MLLEIININGGLYLIDNFVMELYIKLYKLCLMYILLKML